MVLEVAPLVKRNALVHVVDDDDAFRRAISRLLKASGYAVKSYDSVLAFLADTPTLTKACLILDIRMPGMTGLELVSYMVDSGMNIPTILISAHDEEHEWHGDRPPVLACLQKPVREEVLLEAIERGLSMQDRAS